jgi:hypothetical protein
MPLFMIPEEDKRLACTKFLAYLLFPLKMPGKLFRCIARIDQHRQAIMAVQISPDASMVLTGGQYLIDSCLREFLH